MNELEAILKRFGIEGEAKAEILAFFERFSGPKLPEGSMRLLKHLTDHSPRIQELDSEAGFRRARDRSISGYSPTPGSPKEARLPPATRAS